MNSSVCRKEITLKWKGEFEPEICIFFGMWFGGLVFCSQNRSVIFHLATCELLNLNFKFITQLLLSANFIAHSSVPWCCSV